MPSTFSPSSAPRILIIRLSSIGDCVMASPLAQALRAHFPNAHIAWAVREKSRTIVETNPFINEIILWRGGLRGLPRLAQAVRRKRFDVVLETQGLLHSTLLMALSGAPKRLVSPNFGLLAKLLSTQIIEHPQGWIYPPDRYLYWAKALGAPLPQQPQLTVGLTDDDERAARDFLREQGAENALLIGLNPGCSALNRKWSVERFAHTAQILAAQFPDAKFVLCGGPQDRDDTAVLMAALPNRALDSAGKLSLRAAAALIEKCAVMLTNDTGPMHIAVAVQTPVVAVCGPIAAARRLPLHYPACPHVGIEANRNCLPPHHPQCGKEQSCACLAAVEPEIVARAAARVLERSEHRKHRRKDQVNAPT